MVYVSSELLHYVILPLMSAQLFLMVSLYFTFVGRHVLNGIKLFNCFIAVYIVYLVGHVIQMFSEAPLTYLILYFRISLFLIVGLPSLTLFLFVQCGVELRKLWYVLPYCFGGVMSIIYIVCSDALHLNMIFDSSYKQLFPSTIFGANHIDAEMMALIILSLLPVSFLLYHELRTEKRKTCLSFLIGALLVSVLYIVGLYYRVYWLYYIGSMLTGIYWVWVVYFDVKLTKTQAQQLKEKLQLFARKDESDFQPVLNKLFSTIENDSLGNLKRYKFKIREILDQLTNALIEAGGDEEGLLERNLTKIEIILKSEDANTIRELATKETIDLTNMISQLPVKRSEKIISQTKAFIEHNFQDNIEVADLAVATNVSQSYLMRCFKKDTGQTIKQYLTQCRIEKAKTLLEELSVSDTAFAVGYNDSNYFGNVFKRLTGIGPQQYKKENFS